MSLRSTKVSIEHWGPLVTYQASIVVAAGVTVGGFMEVVWKSEQSTQGDDYVSGVRAKGGTRVEPNGVGARGSKGA